MNENVKWGAAAVAVVGVLIGGMLWFSRWKRAEEPPAPPPAVVDATPPPVVEEEPAVRHPLPEPEPQAALPGLDDSDPPMRGALEGLFGRGAVEQFGVTEDVIRKIVVTIDNLSTEHLAERVRPVKRIPGELRVAGEEDSFELDPANFERYKPLVELLRGLDTEFLVSTYVRYYPLFQEAYANLGHPPEYFNDRLIQVIDHLLETPDLPQPLALTRPGMRYEYADPSIESRSSGQKLLIRMGPENAAVIKTKLRELRAALVTQPQR